MTQQKTAEEILLRRNIVFHYKDQLTVYNRLYVLDLIAAMEEYAASQTEQLRKENASLRKQLADYKEQAGIAIDERDEMLSSTKQEIEQKPEHMDLRGFDKLHPEMRQYAERDKIDARTFLMSMYQLEYENELVTAQQAYTAMYDYVSPLHSRIAELERAFANGNEVYQDDVKDLREQIQSLEAENEELRKKGQWISVKERWPEDCDKVLVCLSDDCILVGRIWSNNVWSAFFVDGECELSERTVEFWQPLPSKPENK